MIGEYLSVLALIHIHYGMMVLIILMKNSSTRFVNFIQEIWNWKTLFFRINFSFVSFNLICSIYIKLDVMQVILCH